MHCAARINDTHTFIGGGYKMMGSPIMKRSTWIYNWELGSYTRFVDLPRDSTDQMCLAFGTRKLMVFTGTLVSYLIT